MVDAATGAAAEGQVETPALSAEQEEIEVTGSDILSMSDEDFLNAGSPEKAVEHIQKAEAEPAPEVVTGSEEEPKADPETPETPKVEEPKKDESQPPVTEPKKEETPPAVTPKEGDPKPAVTAEAAPETPDYKAFYEQMNAPFKANGKEIKDLTPAERIQLMQMGANYTSKMQALQPHRKLLLMMENNGLLDQDKLSYLIDLNNKNPDAIKKLVKDAGLDPLEIDTSVEPAYVGTNHSVSDEEVLFKNAIDEMSSTDSGRETLQAINDGWDEKSKQHLWKEPSLMGVIQRQRENGVYDRIVGEIDRQKMLGTITAGTPFLDSYQKVGDKIRDAGGFADLIQPKTTEVTPTAPVVEPKVETPQTPVVTRVVTPPPVVTNGDKAGAASTTRTTTKSAKPILTAQDIFSMSDEDFLKNLNGKL